MTNRFASLWALTPPPDAAVLWVETTDQALHFIDGLFMTTDGLANVRREYREDNGRKFYKLYVSPQGKDDVISLLKHAAKFAPVGELRWDQ